jgi:hypothetical protein
MSSLEIISEEELTIDSIHGLKAFHSYVEDAYQAFMAEAHAVDSPAVPGLIHRVEAVYAEINALVTRYIKILDWGGEIGVDQAELLQQFYNQIIDAYDSLHASPAESSKVVLINQVEAATFLLERGVRLLEAFAEIQTTPLNSPAIKAGKNSYAALQKNCTDAKIIFDAIEATVQTASLDDATMIAREQAQGLKEIEDTFDRLEKNLTSLFESGVLEEVPHQAKSKSKPIPITNRSNAVFRREEAVTVFSQIIKRIMAIPRYGAVVKELYSSPSAFEAALGREVYRVEAPSKLDALLGVKHGSAFLLLKDMTLSEIEQFDGTQDRPAIRARLAEHNIPYEIYMNWIEAIPYMKSLTRASDDMMFSEVFVRSEVELLLDGNQEAVMHRVFINK